VEIPFSRQSLTYHPSLLLLLPPGKTSLHYAVINGSISLASFLLSRGASLLATDDEGYTPLICACYFKRERLLALLLSSLPPSLPPSLLIDLPLAADVLHMGKTALHISCLKQFPQGVQLLLKRGKLGPPPSLPPSGY
jgi:ankyrin repeat protein